MNFQLWMVYVSYVCSVIKFHLGCKVMWIITDGRDDDGRTSAASNNVFPLVLLPVRSLVCPQVIPTCPINPLLAVHSLATLRTAYH